MLNRAPEFSRWLIKTEEPGPRDKSQKSKKSLKGRREEARETTVTKTGPIIHEASVDDQRITTDKWCKGKFQITTRPDWKEPLVSIEGKPEGPAYIDYSHSDFPDFDWISEKNYAGIEKVSDRVCLVFKQEISELPGPESKEAVEPSRDTPADPASSNRKESTSLVAYIDYYSRLPVSVSEGDEKRSYQFEVPPETMLTIPENVQAVMNAWEKRIEELSRSPARPF